MTREQEQFILDALAKVCGDQYGAELTFTLKDEETHEEKAAQ